MKSIRRFSGGVGLALFFVAAMSDLTAPSQDFQAVSWFKIGLREKDPQKKILAYSKAIELDPNFIEALLNLGVVYKQKGDYANAEHFLLRAINAKPAVTKDEMKPRILYELAATYKKLGKPERAVETFVNAKSLAGASQQFVATISAELARLYYEQNRYDLALSEMQTSIRLNPENRNKFAGLLEAIQTTPILQALYERAVQARQRGNLGEAKALFEQILAKNPQFKDVQTQAAELDSRLAIEAKKLEAEKNMSAQYDSAKRLEAEGKLEPAIAAYENLLQQTGGAYKDASERIQNARKQLAQNQLTEKLESEYAVGITAQKARDWPRAIVSFEKIIETVPAFRDTRRRLAAAKRALQQENRQALAEEPGAAASQEAPAASTATQDDMGEAMAALKKVRENDPNARVGTILKEITEALGQKAQPAEPASATAHLDSLYQAAMTAMIREDWVHAAFVLEKLQILQPNYRDVADLLARTRVRLSMASPTDIETASAHKTGRGSLLYYGGALVVLVAVGALALLPSNRARLHLWRGNQEAAAKIYEKMLENSPDRVSLYPVLADLYVQGGRRDGQAMEVYTKTLELDLPERKRKQLNSFVMEGYLEEKPSIGAENMEPGENQG
jgi:tetratricopeptide (TPR) repeat protein